MVRDVLAEHVASLLKGEGFVVSFVPEEPQQRRADLRVVKGSISTYIEVKSHFQNGKLRHAIDEATATGKAVTWSEPSGKTNSLSAVVESAARQLRATAGVDDFRCLWFCTSDHRETVDTDEQMIGTLLGVRGVYTRRGKEALTLNCYFAGYSDFYRFPEIDGAVIDIDDGRAMMVPNTFSPRAQGFQQSPLYKFFSDHDAVKDIFREEAAGRAYIADGEIDRSKDTEIIGHLRRKYPKDTALTLFDLGLHSAVKSVARS